MFHAAKTEFVAEADRQNWFRQQPMYARRFHRRDELDNPEWLQSSAKTELVAGKYYLVKNGRVFGTELQVCTF